MDRDDHRKMSKARSGSEMDDRAVVRAVGVTGGRSWCVHDWNWDEIGVETGLSDREEK